MRPSIDSDDLESGTVSSREIARIRASQKCVHVIPVVVLLCLFILWFYSYRVSLKISDGRIEMISETKMPEPVINETHVDVAVLTLPTPPITFNSVSAQKLTMTNATAAAPQPIQIGVGGLELWSGLGISGSPRRGGELTQMALQDVLPKGLKESTRSTFSTTKTVSSSPITNHLTSFIPSLKVSETTLEILKADRLPWRFVYLKLEVSPEIRISGKPSSLLVLTFLSNQTTPLLSSGLHHIFIYSFLLSHKFDDAAMPNTMCLSSVSYLLGLSGNVGIKACEEFEFGRVEEVEENHGDEQPGDGVAEGGEAGMGALLVVVVRGGGGGGRAHLVRRKRHEESYYKAHSTRNTYVNFGGNRAERYSNVLIIIRRPFTEEVDLFPTPPNFKMPPCESYDGTGDPMEHLARFTSGLNLHLVPDQIMCRIFPVRMKGAAHVWFQHLAPRSISCWAQLAESFQSNLLTSHVQRKNSSALFRIVQGPKESLKSYYARFNSEKLLIDHSDPGVTFAAMARRVRPGTPLHFSLNKHPPENMTDHLDRVEKYLRAEEDSSTS
ncbi:hypothetical protein RJ639_013785 [Escallonia herrerae]|uniref:Retrotransposon gag domain-containing protein n=1 Tax=Escallonia herrerae TaxID=1293975 RepID=A0AA89ANW5_9ASTE|nr:hypothetical protein RJ639_013785 [Escallonia herrerae]